MGRMRARYGVPLGITAVGAAGLLYSAGFEARSFRLRRVTVPVLPAGMRPLRVLQVSGLAVTRPLYAWLLLVPLALLMLGALLLRVAWSKHYQDGRR